METPTISHKIFETKNKDKDSKYFKTDCLQDFILYYVSLLTVKFVKKSHVWTRICFIFLKNVLKQP